jgi:cephalosporin hydroxylase
MKLQCQKTSNYPTLKTRPQPWFWKRPPKMLIFDIKPDLIIEIGTNHGGAALYMANMLDIIGEGEIHTIDIKEYEINDLVKNHPRIKRFLSGFENYDLNLTKGFKKVMVIDDGSHTYDDVLISYKTIRRRIIPSIWTISVKNKVIIIIKNIIC